MVRSFLTFAQIARQDAEKHFIQDILRNVSAVLLAFLKPPVHVRVELSDAVALRESDEVPSPNLADDRRTALMVNAKAPPQFYAIVFVTGVRFSFPVRLFIHGVANNFVQLLREQYAVLADHAEVSGAAELFESDLGCLLRCPIQDMAPSMMALAA